MSVDQKIQLCLNEIKEGLSLSEENIQMLTVALSLGPQCYEFLVATIKLPQTTMKSLVIKLYMSGLITVPTKIVAPWRKVDTNTGEVIFLKHNLSEFRTLTAAKTAWSKLSEVEKARYLTAHSYSKGTVSETHNIIV